MKSHSRTFWNVSNIFHLNVLISEETLEKQWERSEKSLYKYLLIISQVDFSIGQT